MNSYNFRYEYSADFLLKANSLNNSNTSYAGFAPQYSGSESLASRSVDSSNLFELYPEIARNGLSVLKFNKQEVQTAANYLNGNPFIGQEALESNFKAIAPEKGVLHLAMHALTNDKNPLYSQLIFSEEAETSEDGILHAFELYNMRLKANLAVLSACDTGSGKLHKGEGIMSLSRAFKYAGCPNIVMSLWKANDETTKDIIVDFYKSLKDDKGKAQALTESKKKFLATCDQKYTHPYYWATFVLIGDNESIEFGRPLWHYLIGVFAIILALYFTFRLVGSKTIN